MKIQKKELCALIRDAVRAEMSAQKRETKLIKIDDVAAMLSVCRQTLYALQRDEGLPPPIKVGGSKRYDSHEISDWIASRSAHTPKTIRD